MELFKNESPRGNRNNEHYLDVSPSNDDKQFIIYDLSYYLPHWQGQDRNRRLERVDHTIKGTDKTVYIVDYFGVLDYEQAKRIAIAYITGNTYRYRLD